MTFLFAFLLNNILIIIFKHLIFQGFKLIPTPLNKPELNFACSLLPITMFLKGLTKVYRK